MVRGKGKKQTTNRLLESALNERIIQLLSESPGLKTSDLAEQLGVDQLQVRNELMSLEQQLEVSRTGQTRGTRWYIGQKNQTFDDIESGRGARDSKPTVDSGHRLQNKKLSDTSEFKKTASSGTDNGRRGPKKRVLDGHRAILGQIPDADVAERTGVSVRTIAGYRKKYGIPGYSGPRRRGDKNDRAIQGVTALRPTRVDARVDTRSPTAGAWRIEMREHGETIIRYAFAGNLVEAAKAASEEAQAQGVEVLSIVFAGTLL